MTSRRMRVILVFLLFVPVAIYFGLSLLSDSSGGTGIYPHELEYFVDHSGKLEFADVLSVKFDLHENTRPLNTGYTNATVWVRFKFPETESTSPYLLEVKYPLDLVELFYQNKGGQYLTERSGEMILFHDKPLKHRNQLFEINTVQMNVSKPLYLKIKSKTVIIVPLTIWSYKTFLEKVNREQFVLGIFYGFILVMIFYHAGIYLHLREKSYLYYVLLLVGFFLLQMSVNNLADQYLWPRNEKIYHWLENHATPIFMGISFLFLNLFTAEVLNRFKKTALVLRIFAIFSLLLVGMAAVMPYQTVMKPALHFTLISSIVNLVFSWNAYRLRRKDYYFLFYGWTVYFFGMICVVLKTFGILPSNFITNYSVQFGFAFEMIFFSLFLADRIRVYREEREFALKKAMLSEQQVMASRSVEELARQVAHDIKSPLAALNVAATQFKELPEESRLLLRSALQRIHDIANDLSIKKKTLQEQGEGVKSVENHLLSGILEPLVTEKRLQHRSRINVEIDFDLDQNSYGLFARIEPVEFKRVMSNLINNAVEAISRTGRVDIRLFGDNGDIKITVSDTGKGISHEILPRLTERGETHDKEGGSGLGLYHAKKSIESWGGTLLITSETGKGTQVILTLPMENPPSWFVPKLVLNADMNVVIVDDDNSIHQIWKNRFDPYVKSGLVKIHHFSTPDELIDWHRQHDGKAKTLYLCDFEFLGNSKTGLQVVEELGIAQDTILVTSHFEESNVKGSCDKLGIQLIPKNLAGFVPIEEGLQSHVEAHEASSVLDAVLIDDDHMNLKSWEIMARLNKMKMKGFLEYSDFENESDGISRSTPIYIDSHLSNGQRGELLAKNIKAKGFERVYVATGDTEIDLKTVPWVDRIVGKTPPWV